LHNNPDLIRQSRELARIRLDLEVDLDLDQIKARPPDRAAAYELFKELEFSALTREFADAATVNIPAVDEQLKYQIITSRAGLDGLIRSFWDAEEVGIAIADATLGGDQEHDQQPPAAASANGDESEVDRQCSLNYELAEGIAFSTAAGVAAFVDFNKFSEGREQAVAGLREVLANGLVEKAVHDLKHATGLLAKLDLTLAGVKDDTFLAAYLLDPTRSKYELSDLAREAVGIEHLNQPATGWTDMQWETAVAADLTARTAKVLRQRILENKLETIYSEVELPLAPLLFRMERAGLKVDRTTLADLSNYLGLELKKLTVKIYELAGREFNIGSPKQVGEVLSELEMTSGRKTSTGRISTSKAVLEELAQTFELPRLIIDYRELDKLKSVYTDALPHQIASDGRIHCLLNQTVAATGRLSSASRTCKTFPFAPSWADASGVLLSPNRATRSFPPTILNSSCVCSRILRRIP